MVAKGYNEARWQAMLDDAGYPKTPPRRSARRRSRRAQRPPTPAPAARQAVGGHAPARQATIRSERSARRLRTRDPRHRRAARATRPVAECPMILATWNVNSLNVRLPRLLAGSPRTARRRLPAGNQARGPQVSASWTSRAAGYAAHFAGQKTYNGVAILVRDGLAGDRRRRAAFPDSTTTQKRVIAATVAGVRVVDFYVPNGQSVDSDKYRYKLDWCAAAAALSARRAGAPSECSRCSATSTSRPKTATCTTRRCGPARCCAPSPSAPRSASCSRAGLADSFRLFDQPPATFSWWDYRQLAFPKNHGLRIDHILLSAAAGRAVHREPHRPQRAQGREAVRPRAGARRN